MTEKVYFLTQFLGYLDDIRYFEDDTPKLMASHGLFYFCTGMDIDLVQIIEKADKIMYEEKQRLKKEH